MSANQSVAKTSNSLHLQIDGMHCEACVRRVTQALTRANQGAVQDVKVGSAEVEASAASAPALLAALAKAGFSARVQQ